MFFALDDRDLPLYSSAKASEAAGISQSTLGNWLAPKRGILLLPPSMREEAEQNSGRFLFTRLLIYHLALMANLVNLGFKPRRASYVVAGFTQIGSDDLPPGHLFANGHNVLMVCLHDQTGELYSVEGGDTLAKLIEKTQGARFPHFLDFALVNVTQTFHRVDAVLAK